MAHYKLNNVNRLALENFVLIALIHIRLSVSLTFCLYIAGTVAPKSNFRIEPLYTYLHRTWPTAHLPDASRSVGSSSAN